MFTILMLVCLFTVFRVVYEIILERKCIDDETFEKFKSGKLKERDYKNYRRVISHLGICEKCQEKLNEITFGKPLEDHLVGEGD